MAFLAANPIRLLAGETLLEFRDANLMIRAEVLQHQLGSIGPGCRAEVSLDFVDAKPAGATVESIELRADTQAGEAYPKFGVKLALDAPVEWLRADMKVSVRIHADGKKGTPASP